MVAAWGAPKQRASALEPRFARVWTGTTALPCLARRRIDVAKIQRPWRSHRLDEDARRRLVGAGAEPPLHHLGKSPVRLEREESHLEPRAGRERDSVQPLPRRGWVAGWSELMRWWRAAPSDRVGENSAGRCHRVGLEAPDQSRLPESGRTAEAVRCRRGHLSARAHVRSDERWWSSRAPPH